MTKPRLTKEELERIREHLRNYHIHPMLPAAGVRLLDEHAAAMALLEEVHGGGVSQSVAFEFMAFHLPHLPAKFEALGIGKKAPTLEEFWVACPVPVRERNKAGNTTGEFMSFISRDGFRLARVTVSEDKLVVAAHDLSQSRNESGRFPDASLAVEFVARFLGVES